MKQFLIFEKFNIFRRSINTNVFDPSKFALFAGGNTGAAIDVVTTAKYFYSNDSISSGQNLANRRSKCAAAGNSTKAIFAGGKVNEFTSNSIERYIFATNVSSNLGVILQIGRYLLAGSGNATRAIFQQGIVSANPGTTASDKFTYSNDIRVNANSLGSPARHALAASANSEFGIYRGGYNGTSYVSTSNKYTFSNDSVLSTQALINAIGFLSATGNSTKGIFAGGKNQNTGGSDTNITEIFNYADSTNSPSQSLSVARSSLGATGDTTTGIFTGGDTGSPSSVTDKYNYSTDNITPGTSLNTATKSLVGCSSVPGGF